MRMDGKRALVTGAASGIGKTVVSSFLQEGAQVIAAEIEYPVADCPDRENRRHVHLDVAEESDWERLGASANSLDEVVACAGISDVRSIRWRRTRRYCPAATSERIPCALFTAILLQQVVP